MCMYCYLCIVIYTFLDPFARMHARNDLQKRSKTGTRDVVGEFGGICMPNSPLPLAKTMLETLAACQKWCKIGGAPDLEWRDIDLSPNPAEVGCRRRRCNI